MLSGSHAGTYYRPAVGGGVIFLFNCTRVGYNIQTTDFMPKYFWKNGWFKAINFVFTSQSLW